MAALNPAARRLVDSGRLAHLVTVAADGSPHVAIVWVGMDGDEIVSGHLDPNQQKLHNLRRDPRVALSIESDQVNAHGLQEHLVVYGRVRLTTGGAPELLQRLAHVYLGPEVDFPPMPDPPPGVVCHVEVERIAGVGDWSA